MDSISFDTTCLTDDVLTVAVVGDFLFHRPIQEQSYRNKLGIESILNSTKRILQSADIAYGNLEGPVATGFWSINRKDKDPGPKYDGFVYSSYPMFNYHDSMVDGIKALGVDVLSTSNNHALDRGNKGLDATVSVLRDKKIKITGTVSSKDGERLWYTLAHNKGYVTAWLACTYGTNGIHDHTGQVLNCYDDREQIVTIIKDLKEKPGIDLIFVTPHWGVEYQPEPNTKELELGQTFAEAGASAVIGSHPHVIQPWQTVRTKDGRLVLIMYSLGNFISGQDTFDQRTSIIGIIQFHKMNTNPEIAGAAYVPVHTYVKGGLWQVQPYYLLPKSKKEKVRNHLIQRLPSNLMLSNWGGEDLIEKCYSDKKISTFLEIYNYEPVMRKRTNRFKKSFHELFDESKK